MMERYALDPSMVSLDRFYALTLSEQMLKAHGEPNVNTDQHFENLKSAGISTLGELRIWLKSKQQLPDLSTAAAIPVDTLVMMKREADSYLPRTFPLTKFPGVPYEFVEVLKSTGISHAKNFFESVQTSEQRHEVSAATGIPEARLMEIFVLCNLSRIPGMDGNFARVLYLAGIRSMDELADSNAEVLYPKTLTIIEKHGYKVRNISEVLIRICIGKAGLIRECARIKEAP